MSGVTPDNKGKPGGKPPYKGGKTLQSESLIRLKNAVRHGTTTIDHHWCHHDLHPMNHLLA